MSFQIMIFMIMLFRIMISWINNHCWLPAKIQRYKKGYEWEDNVIFRMMLFQIMLLMFMLFIIMLFRIMLSWINNYCWFPAKIQGDKKG